MAVILKNAQILNDRFELLAADLATQGEWIDQIAPGLSGSEEYDCKGCVVVPGFIDIHIHGCAGADTCDADADGLTKMCGYLVSKGVTSFCPTTMTVPYGQIKRILSVVKQCMDCPPAGAHISGVNMEGPYLSLCKKGAQSGEFMKDPNFSEFNNLYDDCGGIVKLVDLAPECSGAEDFILKASRLCTVSIAHTAADYDCAKHAFDLGVTHATHLYNAMPDYFHRSPGTVGAVFDDERVAAELICDGNHIHPAVLRAAFRLLGEDRSIIISDSMRAAGMPDGVSELGGQTVSVCNGQASLSDGTIAGSTADIHQEIKNLIKWGVPFRQVMKSATINPARAIREDETIGSIQIGKYADLVVLDADLNIKLVFIRGKCEVDNR